MARDGLTEDAARADRGAVADCRKVARADFVINTDGSQGETDRRIAEVYRELLG